MKLTNEFLQRHGFKLISCDGELRGDDRYWTHHKLPVSLSTLKNGYSEYTVNGVGKYLDSEEELSELFQFFTGSPLIEPDLSSLNPNTEPIFEYLSDEDQRILQRALDCFEFLYHEDKAFTPDSDCYKSMIELEHRIKMSKHHELS